VRKFTFTSESVTEGHPDKMADQVSDAVLDAILTEDPHGRVACETLLTTGLCVVAGEITTSAYVDIPKIAREVIKGIGYDNALYGFDGNTCGVIVSIDEQSSDIAMGVDSSEETRSGQSGEDKLNSQGAGDQGMMFGYACNETPELMPLPIDLAHRMAEKLAEVRKSGAIPYLRPDAKSQVTIEYSDDNVPQRIDTIVVSTQHDDFDSEATMLAKIKKDIIEIVIPRVKAKLKPALQALFNDAITYHINPTGKFVIGGPHGDTGLTGRKIIVDTYGGKGAHGGGAFSGKDPSKVDRSAAYATRHMAKNAVAAGLCDELLVQVSYAIGVAKPCGLYVNTYGTAKVDMTDGQIAEKLSEIFDMRPYFIEQRLKLRNPIYQETAAYGHMGRKHEKVTKSFKAPDGSVITREVELFTWEELNYVDQVKAAFGL
jgi:S-adenosylmethionine synthetase